MEKSKGLEHASDRRCASVTSAISTKGLQISL